MASWIVLGRIGQGETGHNRTLISPSKDLEAFATNILYSVSLCYLKK